MVTVTLPAARLGVTRILAFGDSITEGEVPAPDEFAGAIAFRVGPRYVEPNQAYPADLAARLAQQYTTQNVSPVVDAFTFILSSDSNDCTSDPPVPTTSGIVVVNAGCLGAKAYGPMTLNRLQDKIAVYQPDLLLLLIGVNDLDSSNPAASISAAIQGVESLIGYARSKGVQVMVGTLLPEIPGDVNGVAASVIRPFNSQLVTAATSAGARVVDLYSDIVTDVTDWIAYDGLHPTAAGYQEMARVWFNSIKNAFELSPASAATMNHLARPSAGVRVAPRR